MSYLSDLLGSAYKEGMSEDDISNALQSVNNNEINKLKAALSKSNSEAADYKKQLRSKMSEEEAASIAQKETLDALTKENAELKRSIDLASKKTKLIGIGYDEKLAEDTAIAMIDGDMDKVMTNQQKYVEAREKQFKTEQLKNTPRPTSGSEPGGNNYQKLIDEAQAAGNIAAVAYYTRLSNMENE